MRKIASALVVVAGILQGCGGGGSSGGEEPSTTSYSLTASVSGLQGSLTLAANSESAVTITSNTQTTLARLPAATPYSIQITSQPAHQRCTLDSSGGTLNTNVTIAVLCIDQIAARKSTFGGFEVARFDVVGLALQTDKYSGSIDGSVPVTLAAVEGGLAMLMPPLADGSHRLEILIDGVKYPIDFTLSTPALPGTPAQIAADYVSEAESALAQFRSDPEFSTMGDWTAIDAELAKLKADFATLSAADMDALARILSINEVAAGAAANAKLEQLAQLKYNDSTCLGTHRAVTSHAIDSFAYLSNAVAVVAIGAEFGPHGVLAGLAVAGAIYKVKAWPAMSRFWSAIKQYEGQQCFAFHQLNFDLKLEERFSRKPTSNAILMSTTQETLTFNHKRMREYGVTGSGTLPEDLSGSASLAGDLLRYASLLLSDDAKKVLNDWTSTYTRPMDISDFSLSNVSDPRISGILSVVDGALRLNFEYLPQQMPGEPVNFTFVLSGNNQSWQIPARLNLIDPPIANDADVSTQTNEVLRGELKADFAESFRISLAPVNGTVNLDASSGAFEYTPNTDYSGNDSFMFVAVNARGDSLPATVRITVAGLCELKNEGALIELTCYKDEQKTQIDFVESLTSGGGVLNVLRYSVVQLIPGDQNSLVWPERYSYRFYDGLTLVEHEKAQFHVMPGSNSIVTQLDERASIDYLNGEPDRTSWTRINNNFASMTGRSESVFCQGGQYTWRVATTMIDPSGASYETAHLRNDINVTGACPMTEEEKLSVLPLKLEDFRVWQLWNAQNGG